MKPGRYSWLAVLAGLVALAGCARQVGSPGSSRSQGPSATEAVVNVYNWYDYLKPDLLKQFQARTGIKVNYSLFDSNNTLATRLLAGRSGYDVVFPSASTLQLLVQAGAIGALPPGQLRNAGNLDPRIMGLLAQHDPGNRHGIVYAWGITGFIYDEAQIRQRMPDAPVASWSMLFDPKVASRFADCGIGLYESPAYIVSSVLAWLGLDPDSEDPANLARAEEALLAVRPYIRKIGNDSLVDQLASGELCLIIGSTGDALQARERVQIAGSGRKIGFTIPKEGAVLWMDTAAIPADAPHRDNALKFIDFLLDPKVAAENSISIHFPNANAAAQPLLPQELTNAAIWPTGTQAAKIIPERQASEAFVRLRTRAWTRFRTGM